MLNDPPNLRGADLLRRKLKVARQSALTRRWVALIMKLRRIGLLAFSVGIASQFWCESVASKPCH